MDVSVIFALVAGIIVIGFAGELFFKKTGIPIYIFLILAGIILGPILNLFSKRIFDSRTCHFCRADLIHGSVLRWIGLKY